MTRTHYQETILMRKQIATLFAALVMAFALLIPGEASSSSVEHDTHLTFEHPVRISGTTVPAGRYVFQNAKNGHTVWVLSEDDGTVFGPYLTVPRSRTTASRERVVVCERPLAAGGTPTVRAWFGRNQLDGREFVDAPNGRD